jgi:ATP synthase protein I
MSPTIKKTAQIYKGSAGYATVGLEIAFAIAVAMFVGSWLDRRWGTDPWLTWAGFAFGVATGVHSVLRAVRMMRAETIREEREQGNPAPLYETDADRAVRRREERIAKENDGGEENAK